MCVLLDIIQKSDNIKYVNILRRHQHCKLLHNASRAARSHAVLVIPVAADRTRMLLQSSRPTHQTLACIFSLPYTANRIPHICIPRWQARKEQARTPRRLLVRPVYVAVLFSILHFIPLFFASTTPPPLSSDILYLHRMTHEMDRGLMMLSFLWHDIESRDGRKQEGCGRLQESS